MFEIRNSNSEIEKKTSFETLKRNKLNKKLNAILSTSTTTTAASNLTYVTVAISHSAVSLLPLPPPPHSRMKIFCHT